MADFLLGVDTLRPGTLELVYYYTPTDVNVSINDLASFRLEKMNEQSFISLT